MTITSTLLYWTQIVRVQLSLWLQFAHGNYNLCLVCPATTLSLLNIKAWCNYTYYGNIEAGEVPIAHSVTIVNRFQIILAGSTMWEDPGGRVCVVLDIAQAICPSSSGDQPEEGKHSSDHKVLKTENNNCDIPSHCKIG